MNKNIPELSIAIPFYNEEDNAERVINDIVKEFNSNNFDYEIVAVNNGSTDNTENILKKLNKSNSRIKIVKVEKNIGYGYGIIQGLNDCNGKFIGYYWGDGQVPPIYITKIFKKIKEENYDLGKITRVYREYSLTRKIVSRFFNVLFPLMFGIHSKDVNGCPKIIKRDEIKSLNLESKDWFLDSEIMIKAKRKKYKIVEIPAEYKKRIGGKSKVKSYVIFEFLKNMIKFKMKGY